MKNQTALTSTFWYGVINYMRASEVSQPLKPKDLSMETAAKTVLVFRTSIEGTIDQSRIAKQMNDLVGKNNWTIDMEDVDKVLRVVGLPENSQKIISILHRQEFHCEIMS